MRGILRSLPSQPTINSSARIGNRFIPRPDEMVSYGGGVFDADRPCPLMTAKSGADSVLNAPVEVKERKDRVDDAMHATRAAVEEGILPGGGVALLRAIKAIERIRTSNDDQKHGVDIVRKALSWPARQIAINAGEDGSVVVGKILDKEQYNYGFDAQNGEYGNLMTKGIIDPAKVVRAALQGAASVAGLLITTEAMVAEIPKKQSAGPAMPPGGGMDY